VRATHQLSLKSLHFGFTVLNTHTSVEELLWDLRSLKMCVVIQIQVERFALFEIIILLRA
jgi:hypothetical protein